MKKSRSAVIISVIAVILLSVYMITTSTNPEENTKQKLSVCWVQYYEKKTQNYNVSEAENLIILAEQAMEKGEYLEADERLNNASLSLDVAKIPPYLTARNPHSDRSWIQDGPIYEMHPYYANGTFKGLTEQIPSIADLGVKTIYLMPIWEHAPIPPYGEYRYGYVYHIYDYYNISTEYGTKEDLIELVDTVHNHNMSIIFDLVTCATPEGSTIYKNGGTIDISLSKLKELGISLDSKSYDGVEYVYHDCDFSQTPQTCELFGWMVDDRVVLRYYPIIGFGWAVDRVNPDVIDYFTEVAEYHVREYDIDGWRIDAPQNNWNPGIVQKDHSATILLNSIEEAVTKVKTDAILLGESPMAVYKMNAGPIFDKTCKISCSYYFYIELCDSFDKMIAGKRTSNDLTNALANEKIWYGQTRARFIETHDTPRAQYLAPGQNKPLIVLISTIPGVPMIQSGQEIGETKPYNSHPAVDWEKGNYELREFYKKVFKIRKENDALKYGDIKDVWKSGDSAYAYLRSYDNNSVVVLLNFQSKTVRSTLNLPFSPESTLYDALNNETFIVDDPGNFLITIPALGTKILVLQNE